MNLFKKKTSDSAPVHDDLESVMKKYDKESNTRVWEGTPKIVVTCILAAFSLFCLYVTLFASWLEEIRLTSFVAFIVFLGYLIFPARKGHQRTNYIPWYDIILMLVGTGSFLYFTFNAVSIIHQGALFKTYQIVIGIIGILSLAEVCRRSVGLPILLVASAFLIYALTVGLSNPDFFRRVSYAVRQLFYSKEGIFSTPVNVCSKFIVVFIIFGAFLERTGIAEYFIQIANTVGSGSVTIPLMKKTGYKSEFAAATEAAASTGGQIMPPIMGAAAFLMAEYVQEPYSRIVLRAILPAVLYFTGIFISVHLEAKKLGLEGLKKEDLPKVLPLLKKSYLLFPLFLLIYLVVTSSRSIQYAAAISIVACIVVSMFNKDSRITPKRLLEALAAGGQGTITVAAACGIAGIIAGTITMTGLASNIISGVVALAGGSVFLALLLTMVCCIVLGMGVPTTATYCIMAATCAPILVQMGVPTVAAHFFVFYFGIVADLTPPVALAAYAGAAIAKASPMKTAVTATKLAIGAFIVPYAFAMSPAMLLIDTNVLEVILICITAFIGICCISASLEGYLLEHMPWYERLLCLVGGLMLILPGTVTDLGGIALAVIVAALQFVAHRRAPAAA